MSSSVHIDVKIGDILIFGEETTQEFDNTKLPAEAKYPITFTQSGKVVLNLHYNGSNSFS